MTKALLSSSPTKGCVSISDIIRKPAFAVVLVPDLLSICSENNPRKEKRTDRCQGKTRQRRRSELGSADISHLPHAWCTRNRKLSRRNPQSHIDCTGRTRRRSWRCCRTSPRRWMGYHRCHNLERQEMPFLLLLHPFTDSSL